MALLLSSRWLYIPAFSFASSIYSFSLTIHISIHQGVDVPNHIIITIRLSTYSLTGNRMISLFFYIESYDTRTDAQMSVFDGCNFLSICMCVSVHTTSHPTSSRRWDYVFSNKKSRLMKGIRRNESVCTAAAAYFSFIRVDFEYSISTCCVWINWKIQFKSFFVTSKWSISTDSSRFKSPLRTYSVCCVQTNKMLRGKTDIEKTE